MSLLASSMAPPASKDNVTPKPFSRASRSSACSFVVRASSVLITNLGNWADGWETLKSVWPSPERRLVMPRWSGCGGRVRIMAPEESPLATNRADGARAWTSSVKASVSSSVRGGSLRMTKLLGSAPRSISSPVGARPALTSKLCSSCSVGVPRKKTSTKVPPSPGICITMRSSPMVWTTGSVVPRRFTRFSIMLLSLLMSFSLGSFMVGR